MPQNGDRNMISKEDNEKVPHFQAEGAEKSVACDYLYSSYFAITWHVFSLIQVKFLKKFEMAWKK